MLCQAFFGGLLATLLYLVFAQDDIQTCNPGTFRKGFECLKCPPGTFSNNFNTLTCKKCPFGTFRALAGAASKEQCFPCDPGTFADRRGATQCKKCPSGLLSNSGSKLCSNCPPGQRLTRKSKDCIPCSSGSFSDASTNGRCIPCPDGMVSNTENTRCIKCPAGSFKRGRSNRCRDCTEGSFNDVRGAKACKPCPTGTSSGRGSVACAPCLKGTANGQLLGSMCEPCQNGTTTVTEGAAECRKPGQECSVNYFENSEGECQACSFGQILDPKSKTCVECAKNEISQGGDDTECVRCSPNKVPLGREYLEGRSQCVCKPGTVDDGDGGCIACPPGTFWRAPVSTKAVLVFEMDFPTCENCPRESFTSIPGQLSCNRCPANSFQPNFGSRSCIECPEGSRTFPDANSRFSTRRFSTSRNPETGRFSGIFALSCITSDLGCAPGEERGRRGECFAVRCPFEGTSLRERVCFGLPHVLNSPVVTSCPPRRSRISPHVCACREDFADINGECVRCPLGTRRSRQLATLCVPCPDGTVGDPRTSFRECIACPPRSFTLKRGAITCTRCPDATERFRNIVGVLSDFCR